MRVHTSLLILSLKPGALSEQLSHVSCHRVVVQTRFKGYKVYLLESSADVFSTWNTMRDE